MILITSLSLSAQVQVRGLYKTSQNTYRKSHFNPGNLVVDRLSFNEGANYYFSQFIRLEKQLFSCVWDIDLLGKSVFDGNWKNDLDAKQFSFQKDLSNWMLMAGRVILRWGTGYAFNPTDVVAPEKELSDPDNTENRAMGNDMVKLEYFGETYSLAFCYLTKLRIKSGIKTAGSKMALRFYKNIFDIDLSLISLVNKDESPVFGLNFAYVIGERLEIHGETSAQRGSYRNYHRVLRDGIQIFQENPLIESRKNDDRLYTQLLLGFQYTFMRNILWVAEYYRQDHGYSGEEWKKIIDYIKFLKSQLNSPLNELIEGNLLWSLSVFSPKGAMRDYMMNYVSIPFSRKVEVNTICMTNLIDRSFVVIPAFNYTFKNHFTLYAKSFIFNGKSETEFGEMFNSFSIEGGLRFRL